MSSNQKTRDYIAERVSDGSPLAPEMVSRRFLALSRRAGLPRVFLHGLRHTYAIGALAAGVDMHSVSKRLGHARSSFTSDSYTRLPEQVDRDAAGLIAAMVREAGRSAAGEAPGGSREVRASSGLQQMSEADS